MSRGARSRPDSFSHLPSRLRPRSMVPSRVHPGSFLRARARRVAPAHSSSCTLVPSWVRPRSILRAPVVPAACTPRPCRLYPARASGAPAIHLSWIHRGHMVQPSSILDPSARHTCAARRRCRMRPQGIPVRHGSLAPGSLSTTQSGSAGSRRRSEKRVVDVSLVPASVERCGIRSIPGRVQSKALGQIGIGNISGPEGDEIGTTAGNGLPRGISDEAATQDDRPTEGLAQQGRKALVFGRRRRLDEMQIRNAASFQPRRDIAVRLARGRVVDAILPGVGRDAYAHPRRRERVDRRVHHFEQETGSLFDRTAIAIAATVRAVTKELIDEKSVCPMNLHPVEARGADLSRPQWAARLYHRPVVPTCRRGARAQNSALSRA